MKINLYGQRWDNTPFELVKQGDSIFINGEQFDFSPLTDGAELPASAISSKWFMSKMERIDGEVILTMIYPIPANYSPEQATPCFLSDVPDGIVYLPQPLPESVMVIEESVEGLVEAEELVYE